MKKPLAIALALCAVTSLAKANGTAVSDKQELADIRQATEIALTQITAWNCTYDSGKSWNSAELRFFTRAINLSEIVYRDLTSQPVLKFELTEGLQKSFVFVTTDREGKNITSIQLQRSELGGGKTINIGTIANPKLKNLPANWNIIFDGICKTSK